uniref:Uncharacterized protein n=3 Tax=Lepisosteus oculatus TaxID=7918 RepID=W5MAU0_LEPOC
MSNNETTASAKGRCSGYFCCPDRNDSCVQLDCFCDVACFNLSDCCQDFSATCNKGRVVITDFTVTSFTTTSVSLSWNVPSGNYTFLILVIGNEGKTITVNSLSTNITGLVPGNSYTLQISLSSASAENGTDGTPVTITASTKPEVVTNLRVTAISTDSMFLSWNAPTGNLSMYRIWVFGQTMKFVELSTPFTNISGLIPGSSYRLMVAAVAVDRVTQGDTVIVTRSTKPEVVTSLTVLSITTTSIFLNWTGPTANVSGYRVAAIGPQGKSMTVSSLFTNVTELVPGNPYTLQVTAVAVDNFTEGDPVRINNYTKPEVVTGLTSSSTMTSIFLSWDAPAGNASSYRILSSEL